MENKKNDRKIKTETELFIIIWLIVFAFLSVISYDVIVNAILAAILPILCILFYESMSYLMPPKKIVRFEFVGNKYMKSNPENTKLPEKATEFSIAYDFFSPEECIIFPGEKHWFWTDVKVKLRRDEVLVLAPRSSAGTEKSLMLANTIGKIDPDYYGNEGNDGNIGICLFNYGPESVKINVRDRIVQGTIFKVVNDVTETSKKRTGGFGSTGR